jgi:uncharacterized membrane protein YGL010W
VPLTLIIIYNNYSLEKAYSLDYAIIALSLANLLGITIEMGYYKYHKNQGINLEQRVQFSNWIRYKEYMKCSLSALICGSITLIVAITTVQY